MRLLEAQGEAGLVVVGTNKHAMLGETVDLPAGHTCGWSVSVRAFSSTKLRTPYLASSNAVVSPVGPPPAMMTGHSCPLALLAAAGAPAAVASWRQPAAVAATSSRRLAGVAQKPAAPRLRSSGAAMLRAAANCALAIAMLAGVTAAARLLHGLDLELAQQLLQLVLLV